MNKNSPNPCVLCGNATVATVFHFEVADIVRCDRCGLIFADPIPTREEIRGKYGAEYFEWAYSESLNPDTPRTLGVEIMERLERLTTKGRLLDVGCGTGEYLTTARNLGWECYGVDVSPFAVKTANRRPGIKAFAGFPDEAGFEADFFDAAIMVHSLEHQLDPIEVLREVFRVLKPGGVSLISVPNMGSPEAKRKGRSWDGLQIGSHFFFFTPETLRAVAEKAGFQIAALEAPRSVISGQSVNRAIGDRFGSAARKILRRHLGRLPDMIRRGASLLKEGEGIILIARKPDWEK